MLNILTVAERNKMRQDDLRAGRAAGDRVDLGNEVPASAPGAAARSFGCLAACAQTVEGRVSAVGPKKPAYP
ncbi:hypothetical protein OH781_39545 [Streptomyces sp. NBC_01550]|uniref:hypothetical protein n=1 Tax=unclassified Streptomyces TaxID=2593676 RepID=UPI0036C9FA4C